MMLFSFLACSLSAQDAQTVFLSLYQPILDISDESISSSDYNGNVDVDLSLGSNWEGLIISQGTRSDYEDIAHFTLTLGFTDVYITTGDLRVDGDVDLYMEYAIDPTDNLSTTQMMRLSKTLLISGDVQGKAVLDFEIQETFNAQTDITSTIASGDISGTDVSSFAQGNEP